VTSLVAAGFFLAVWV